MPETALTMTCRRSTLHASVMQGKHSSMAAVAGFRSWELTILGARPHGTLSYNFCSSAAVGCCLNVKEMPFAAATREDKRNQWH